MGKGEGAGVRVGGRIYGVYIIEGKEEGYWVGGGGRVHFPIGSHLLKAKNYIALRPIHTLHSQLRNINGFKVNKAW